MPIDEEKRDTLRTFAAVGAGSPLLGLADDGDSDAREAIAGYVEATPGAHFSKIRDDLSLATGETQYHLRRLTDTEVLEASRDGDYKRYFLAGEFDAFERTALGYLRRDTCRGMLLGLLKDPTLTGAELASKIGVSAAAISSAASEMEAAGLLEKDGGFEVRKPEAVISLLLRHGRSFDEETRQFASVAAALFTYDPN